MTLHPAVMRPGSELKRKVALATVPARASITGQTLHVNGGQMMF